MSLHPWVEPIEAAAQAVRDAGFGVVALDGWKDAGHGVTEGRLLGACWHDTVTPPRMSQDRLWDLLRWGYKALPGPIANGGLDRDGTLGLISAGRAYHAGPGSWQGIPSGNLNSFGLEVANRGLGSEEPWTDEQYEAARIFTRVLFVQAGFGPARLFGHLEWAPSRKVDPWSIDMDDARHALATETDMPLSQADIDKIILGLRPVIRDTVRKELSPVRRVANALEFNSDKLRRGVRSLLKRRPFRMKGAEMYLEDVTPKDGP